MVGYVALGDSLAAGWTPYGKKGPGYGEFLEDRFEQSQYTVDFDNYGVPGYTSSQLIKQLSEVESVREAVRQAEIITIDIGANDLLRALKTDNTAQALVTVRKNLDAILATIDSLNPSVKVYVMGYYNPFPYLPEEQQASLLNLLSVLNDIIKTQSSLNGDVYVATDRVIAKHYEEYLPNPEDIHLSLEGYQTIAKEFWKAIMRNQK